MKNKIFKGGRNAPCPCGSGLKYKKCCLGKDEWDPQELRAEYAKKYRIRFKQAADIENIKQALNQDLDWDYFFKQVKKQGISPFVYKTLFESNIDRLIIPDDIWYGLRACYYTVAARNTLLLERLKTKI